MCVPPSPPSHICAKYSILMSHHPWKTCNGQDHDTTVNLPGKLWSMSHGSICSAILKVAKFFINIETEKLWVSPHGEPWHSHVRLFFSPAPYNASHAMLLPGVTPVFLCSATRSLPALRPFQMGLTGTLLLAWSPARPPGSEPVVLEAPFLASPSPPTIQTLESSPPWTQLCPCQHPCPEAGMSPSLLPWT